MAALDPSVLAAFLDRFREPSLVERIAKRVAMDQELVRKRIDLYLNEVPVGFAVASRGLRPGARILEVGAGLQLLSLFLREQGHDIVALEPVGMGFDFFSAASEEILFEAGASGLETLPIRVEELAPALHGTFDFIFSVNVIEHLPDLDAAFRAMASVLAESGSMVHLCPNYTVPYEPHFGIPLVPRAPRLTAKIFDKRIQKDWPEVWPSLNFISAHSVRRLARANGLSVEFDQGLLYDFLTRLERDPIYADRHQGGAVGSAYAVLRRTRLLDLTRHIPVSLTTPMQFTLRRAGA